MKDSGIVGGLPNAILRVLWAYVSENRYLGSEKRLLVQNKARVPCSLPGFALESIVLVNHLLAMKTNLQSGLDGSAVGCPCQPSFISTLQVLCEKQVILDCTNVSSAGSV